MKQWQRYWLYLVIGYASLHIIRDLFQDFGIKNVLSTTLVKSSPSRLPTLWVFVNTYVIALVEIVLSLFCLRKQEFKKVGYATIVIAVATLATWGYYWFFL